MLALSGDLGAGKTTFVKGLMKGLGARGRAASPTFVIVRRHPVRRAAGSGPASVPSSVFHMDAYRLKGPDDLDVLGFDEMAEDPRNIIVVEWAEKIKSRLPKDSIRLRFRHGRTANERSIFLSGKP